MKRSVDGRRLVDLYWQHTAEVVGILLASPSLRAQAKSLITEFQPGVSRLLAAKGQEILITQPMIDQLNFLWNGVAGHASPALKAVLQLEQARFSNFQPFVNYDFTRWAELLALPVPAQPFFHISATGRTAAGLVVEANDLQGAEFSLWRSSNLTAWAQVSSAEALRDGFTLRFTDPAPLAGRAFYQIRW